MGVGVPVEVPRRIDKRVHRVGFATRGTAALWARGIRLAKIGRAREGRLSLTGKSHILGQADRQLIIWHRHDPVFVAIDHRYRRAPNTVGVKYPSLSAR